VQAADLVRRERIRPSLRVDSRPEQRLVDVDIAQTADEALVEEDGLDLARSAPQALFQPCRREFTLERLTAKSLLKTIEIVSVRVDDAAELALIGETKIEAVRELDCQAFEAEWRLLMRDRAQPTGHPQVDDYGGVIVEVDNEVLGSSADTADGASLDPGEDVFDPVACQDAGKIANPQRPDTLTDDLIDQGAADGFDLGEFWHTRMTVARLERCG
jgi:hypothetical protein